MVGTERKGMKARMIRNSQVSYSDPGPAETAKSLRPLCPVSLQARDHCTPRSGMQVGVSQLLLIGNDMVGTFIQLARIGFSFEFISVLSLM